LFRLKEDAVPKSNRAPSASLQLPVEVIGADMYGQQFLELTHTLTIYRNGISLFLETELAPNAELIVRNPETSDEAISLVIGGIPANKGGGEVYAVGFVDPSANPWRVPDADGSETKSIELSCNQCHTKQSHALSEIEFESFQVSGESIHFCQTCDSAKIWKVPAGSAVPEISDTPHRDTELDEVPVGERRRNRRTSLKTVACIRFSGAEVIVECEDVSKGGFRFTSRREYPVGTRIEAAVPYTKSSNNIFCVSGIIYCQKMPNGLFRHGVTYVKNRGTIGWGS
jgi:hypothetical protein